MEVEDQRCRRVGRAVHQPPGHVRSLPESSADPAMSGGSGGSDRDAFLTGPDNRLLGRWPCATIYSGFSSNAGAPGGYMRAIPPLGGSRSTLRRRLSAIVVVAAVSSGTVACSSKTSNNTSANTSGVGTSAPGGQPQPGGTVSWGEFSSPAGLDPIIMTGSGSTGLIQSAGVHEPPPRYHPQSKKYEARLALSATPNTDFTEWTVKLR